MPRNRYYTGPLTDHYDGLRFFNPHQPTTDRGFSQILKWTLERSGTTWKKEPYGERMTKPVAQTDAISVTMVGHASVLIQVSGHNILVDPVWSNRASPVRWMGPKRVNAPGIMLKDLPRIDAVLLTHNHYDHMDKATLRRLEEDHRPRLIAPLGNDSLVEGIFPSARIHAGDWGDVINIGEQVSVTIVPAHHWSARGLGDRRMALWGGFIIQAADGVIYNVGDTGYGDGKIFKEIQAQFGKPDVAIIPIGAYEPRWFMGDQHVNPEEAVRIFQDCGAAQGLGVHWGTFQLTDEARLAPRDALVAALQKAAISRDRFLAFEPGAVWTANAAA